MVDRQLAHKESNWKRIGYLQKLFTPAEQRVISDARDPALLLWLMWTTKESAYKIVNRATETRSYAPLSFSCLKLHVTGTQASGEVIYKEQTLYTNSEIKPTLIHSIAALSEKDLPAIKIHYQQHTDCYLADFNCVFIPYKLYKNSAGVPELIIRETGERCAVSISHHGRHLAIAYSDSPRSAD